MLDSEAKISGKVGESEKIEVSAIALKILETLKSNPQGLDIHEIQKITLGDMQQQHFDRRLRELDPHFIIRRSRDGKRTLYHFTGPRPKGEWDYAEIPKDLAARIRHDARGKCQMCGKTIKEDGIKLHVDHKIPRRWGGQTIEENLWAICSGCNEGKKHYFATFDDEVMLRILAVQDPHERILRTLHLFYQQFVKSDLLQFVANHDDYQEDWQKRLRELRYLDYKIENRRVKDGKRSVSEYSLVNWFEPPANLSQVIRQIERQRNKNKKG